MLAWSTAGNAGVETPSITRSHLMLPPHVDILVLETTHKSAGVQIASLFMKEKYLNRPILGLYWAATRTLELRTAWIPLETLPAVEA
jgi:hypothetical protein